MNKSGFLITAAFLCLFLTGCTKPEQSSAAMSSSNLPELIEIYYFYDEICGACLDSEFFYELFHEEAGDVSGTYPYRLIPVNTAQTSGRAKFEEAMANFGHSTVNADFPIMMINSRLFRGENSIRSNLREAYLTAGEDIFVNRYVYNSLDAPLTLDERFAVNQNRDTIVYFYRIVCPECNQTKPFIDALSGTDIIRINTRSGDNGAVVRKFFDKYNVPEIDQMVPIVFLANGYLAGYENISTELNERIKEGKAKGFSFP